MKKIIGAIMITGIISCKSSNNLNKTPMQLTLEISKILSHLEKIEVFDGQNPLDISRKNYETMALQLSGRKESVAMIEEFNIPSENHQIAARLYRPEGKTGSKSPAVVYLHGGWFISGSYETHDAIVRKLANATGAAVLFVDYRLAPEYPFPAGLDDCAAATKWLIDHAESLGIDLHQIGVIGDSAGAALAVSVTQQLRNQLKFQVLIYPATDPSLSTKSWDTYANGPVLNKEWGRQAWNWYITEKDRENPLAVPVLIKDFKEVPPTLILLAEHDPLHDEGEQLALNMKNAGVSVQTKTYKNMVHGFMHMGGVLQETQSAVDEITLFTNNNFKAIQ
ncbi:alpha/beta hydrolase [Chryseobacterium tongliaoense]|uniref:alpha/beta hydrolase n=1 Tax=Chryseobacterium tongliaoense TaxID=3240933 RepID=UPI0035168086